MRWGSQSISNSLLASSAVLLAAGGSLHGLAYPKASTVVENSSLPPFFQEAFKGLWLSDSLSSLTLALALACIATQPRLAGAPLVLLLTLIPLTTSVTLFLTMGNFFGLFDVGRGCGNVDKCLDEVSTVVVENG